MNVDLVGEVTDSEVMEAGVSLRPFLMCLALPDSRYYGGSVGSRIDRSTTHPHPPRVRADHGRGTGVEGPRDAGGCNRHLYAFRARMLHRHAHPQINRTGVVLGTCRRQPGTV